MNMLWMRLFFVITLVFLSLPLRGRADAVNNDEISHKLRSSSNAIIQIHLSDKYACSAVRVSEKYILSAAHCFFNIKGELMPKWKRPTYIKNHGRKYQLEIKECGLWDIRVS